MGAYTIAVGAYGTRCLHLYSNVDRCSSRGGGLKSDEAPRTAPPSTPWSGCPICPGPPLRAARQRLRPCTLRWARWFRLLCSTLLTPLCQFQGLGTSRYRRGLRERTGPSRWDVPLLPWLWSDSRRSLWREKTASVGSSKATTWCGWFLARLTAADERWKEAVLTVAKPWT